MDFVLNVKLYAETSDLETIPTNKLGIRLNELEGFKIYKTYLNYKEAITELGYRYCKAHNINSFVDGNYLLYFNCDKPQQIIRKSCEELEKELDYSPVKTDCLKLGIVYDEYIILSEEKAKELSKIFNLVDIYDCSADLEVIRKVMEFIGAKCNYYKEILAHQTDRKALMKINVIDTKRNSK